MGQAEPDVKVKLIAPPQYAIITSCSSKADGEKRLTEAIKAIEEKIRTYNGGDAKKKGEVGTVTDRSYLYLMSLSVSLSVPHDWRRRRNSSR